MVDVARQCGVAHSTVSRALAGHAGIPESTRREIQRVAKAMGYRPDARMNELMAQVRQGRMASTQTNLALISFPHTSFNLRQHHRDNYFQGVRDRANQLGYGLRELDIPPAGAEELNLSRIIRNCGINGAVLIDGGGGSIGFDMPWSLCAWATLGFISSDPALHSAMPDHGLDAQNCAAHLLERGYRRIGFIYVRPNDRKMSDTWLAGYAARMLAAGLSPLVYISEEVDLPGLAEWVKENRPDSLITHTSYARNILDPLGARCPVIVSVNLGEIPAGGGKHIGVQARSYESGLAAVDLVVGQLYRGEKGVPSFQKRVLTRGIWHGELPEPPLRCDHTDRIAGQTGPISTVEPAFI